MSDFVDVTLAVLAGGEGRRMGKPKAELRVRGRPILEYLLDRVAWDGPTLLVTAPGRERPPGAERFDREATDREPDMGALGGIVTALEKATTTWAIVCVVDMPGVAKDHVAWIAARRSGLGAMLNRAGRVEPFPMAVSRAALPVLKSRWRRGDRAVKGLATLPDFTSLDAPAEWDDGVWTNLNFPADFQAYARANPDC